MNCPKCSNELIEGECLAHGEHDVTEPCLICEKCEEGFSYEEME